MKLINILKIFAIFLVIIIINYLIVIKKCSQQKDKQSDNDIDDKIKIYFITPTYSRFVQEPELIRLSHTLLLVPNIQWIIVEDNDQKTRLVENFIKNLMKIKIYKNFNVTHLYVATPKSFKTNNHDPNWLKPRGVWQRNEALRWIRKNVITNDNGVIYFGDDDNTYDLRLFKEIRSTKKVSAFPVGLVGGLQVEKPIVFNGKITGFNSIWKPQRKFPIDMSGFAVNIRLIVHDKPDAYFSPYVPRGYQETHLLTQLIQSIDELEPKADLCTKILVWHTRTELPKLSKKKNF